ncbi:hypothetical protein E2C01_087314 [Portunus trituberculatus]|uniref:Uncharacterized protein n=1 Tax=Portunus trituberculatus TaxID=210409 RepID=A0A5B7JC57_PORTR|nr:hypothetical protein [Portunus trituberculatus]
MAPRSSGLPFPEYLQCQQAFWDIPFTVVPCHQTHYPQAWQGLYMVNLPFTSEKH